MTNTSMQHHWQSERSEASGVRREIRHGLRCLSIENDRASALVYLHGAHVAEWCPTGAPPVLWTSPRAVYASDKAIRGGVPICFPWFGAHPTRPELGAHGFARTSDWTYHGSSLATDGALRLEFSLSDTAESRKLWPYAFEARYRVSIGHELCLELEVSNRGAEAFRFEAALHTYFAISDIARVSVAGLKGAPYIDHVLQDAEAVERSEAISFQEEFDRMYASTGRCLLCDSGLRRSIVIDKENSATTVVWNPWSSKAARLADLGAEHFTRMLCIETANAGLNAITLPAGAQHKLLATIRSEQP